MPFIAHPFDVYAWYNYCSSVLNHGFSLNSVLDSVRPLWPLTLAVMAYGYGFLSAITGLKAVPVDDLPSQMNPQWGIRYVPGPLFNVVIKIPLVLSDLAIVFLLYGMVSKRYGVNVGEKAALLFYLNPAVIWISSAWGQYDSIPALFTVLSLYLLVEKRLVQSSLSLLTAALFKIYPAAFLMPVSVYLFKKETVKGLLKFLSVFLVSASVLLVFFRGPISRFIYRFFSSSTFYGIFGFGLTYWSVSMLYPLNAEVFRFVSVGIMMLLISISFYFICKAKHNDLLKNLTFSSILIAASVFLSIRYPTEQRVVWLVPFLAMATSKGYFSQKLFWSLSLLAFLYMQKTFPQYLLPLATYDAGILLPVFQSTEKFRETVQGTLMPSPTSAVILSVLGVSFSILMLKVYLQSLSFIRLS